MLTITALYAGLMAFLFLGLSVRVIMYRRQNKLSLGDEGDRQLLRLMRTQSNCAEYAPFGIILLALIEAQGAPAVAVHALGLMLLSGRLIHAWGFGNITPVMAGRVLGMALTLTMIGLGAAGLILHAML